MKVEDYIIEQPSGYYLADAKGGYALYKEKHSGVTNYSLYRLIVQMIFKRIFMNVFEYGVVMKTPLWNFYMVEQSWNSIRATMGRIFKLQFTSTTKFKEAYIFKPTRGCRNEMRKVSERKLFSNEVDPFPVFRSE